MSGTEPDDVALPQRRLWPWVVAGLVGVVGIIYVMPRQKTIRPIDRTGGAEDSLGQVRQALARETDLTTCRSALQQVTNHLARNPDRAPPLAALPREELKKLLNLDDSDLGEIEGAGYTLLDGRYLEQCFLFRDAAQSLQMNSPAGKGVKGSAPSFTALDRATAAFRWAMRQVRLEEHSYPTAPPVYALRRGWGTPLERSLVFLEMLRQLGPAEELQGCLVYCPAEKDGPPRLWACGVVLEGQSAVHLFDPRLGMPIPGPEGQGVATLGQARKTPAVLGQLTVNDKHPYDVTSEQAARAELRQVVPLSALAPRVGLLQNQLLGPTFNVRLVVAPQADRQRLVSAAVAELGKKDAVRAWQEIAPQQALSGAGLLLRFLSPEEGGSDRPNPDQPRREMLFYHSVHQWTRIPEPFNNPADFPPNADFGRRIHNAFYQPLIESINDPEKPRNLILRGRFGKAAPKLVEEQVSIRSLLQQQDAITRMAKELREWRNLMFQLYAAQGRKGTTPAQLAQINQQIEEGWANARALGVVFAVVTARTRTVYLGYLLGLCKHDQAEIRQARSGAGSDDPATRNAWQDALDSWDHFLDEYPNDPASGAARQLRAQALDKMGQLQEAAAAWENLSGPVSPLEKVTGLYQAQELRKRIAKKE